LKREGSLSGNNPPFFIEHDLFDPEYPGLIVSMIFFHFFWIFLDFSGYKMV
jgi:hypothetical protein